MSDRGSITWSSHPEEFRGDIAATVAVDRHRWQEHGARFSELDDGDGEAMNLAAATLKSNSTEVDFGVLSYGDAETFLLLDVPRDRALLLVREVLDALTQQGILSWKEVLDVSQQIPRETPIAEEIKTKKKNARKTKKTGRSRMVVGRYGAKGHVGLARKKTLKGKVVAFDGDTGYVVVRPDNGSDEIAVRRQQVIARTKRYELPVGTVVRVSPRRSKQVRLAYSERFEV